MEQYLSEVENTLKLVLSASDSIQIQSATDALHQQAFKDERCIPALAFIIQQSPHKQVRQLAAVELRKQTMDWWTKLGLEVKADVKMRLLDVIVNEPEPLPRHATARVIATIGRMDIPVQAWPELVPFVLKCCNSSTVGHRETGLYLISTIFEVTDTLTDDHCEPLRLFSTTIHDPDSLTVRTTTVVAIGKMSTFISTLHVEEIKLLQDLIPHMVQVLGQCVTSNEESQAVKCFDVMEELLKLVISSLVPHLKDFIQFFLQMAANTTVQPKMRVHALSVLSWAVLQKSAKIEQLGLLDPLLKTLLAIGAEEEPEDSDEDSPVRSAFSLLHTVGIHMPPKAVFSAASSDIQTLLSNTDACYRKSGVMALGVLAEGCADIMRPDITVMLQVISGALEDQETSVRRAACVALCAFADQFEDEVSAAHTTLVPKLLSLMDATAPGLTKKVCNTLDAIVLQLDNEFLKYLPMVMERLLLFSSRLQGSALIAVITLIASVARVSHESFETYFELVATRLRGFMALASSEDDLKIRSAATDAMRDVVDAVGKDAFRPYLHGCMILAMEGVLKDNIRLHECGYHFFATAAQVFEAEFSPYLPEIVPHLLRSCSLQDQPKKEDDLEEDLADLDEDETEEDVNLAFNSAIAQEKEIAAGTLAILFEHTREAFMPYLEYSIKVLVDLLDDKSDAVRKAGISAGFGVLRSLYQMSNVTPWRTDLPKVPLHDNVRELCEILIPVVYSLWLSEHDKMVVVLVCQELAETLRFCGSAILFDSLSDVCQQLKLVFEKKAYFQQSIVNEENLLDEDEDDENDTVLICAAADLVSTLATVHGKEFTPYAKTFVPFIMRYYKKTKTPSERSMSMGCLGEITVAIGSGITEFTDKILQLVEKALGDADDEVRSNAAFALGVLCEHTTVDISTHYPTLLQSLYPLFHDQPLVNVTDNACGAVSRMIMKHPQVVPVEQVLPTLVQALPLKAELEENEPVFRFLLSLIQARNGWVLEHLAHIFGLFGESLSKDSKVTESTRQDLLGAMHAFDYPVAVPFTA